MLARRGPSGVRPFSLRLSGLAAIAVALVLVAPGTAAAANPSGAGTVRGDAVRAGLLEAAPVQDAGHGHGGGGGGGGGGSTTPIGYDVSYPQCTGALPTNVAFGIVGVNDGIVYSPNPCLADELLWAETSASSEHGQLYANTANPGPAVSSYWPLGQASPKSCDPADPDSDACNYDYGWNAAADSYRTAVDAYNVNLGTSDVSTPWATTWWLDVETANSWRTDTAKNVAALQGAVDYLLQQKNVASVGFYSTPSMWDTITGGTTVFSGHAGWVAGARTLRAATRNCAAASFTGGTMAMAQYFAGGFDADLPC
jgi:hypothetical protein